MYNAVGVQVAYGRKCCLDNLDGIGLKIGALLADPIEQFTSKGQIGDQVDYTRVSVSSRNRAIETHGCFASQKSRPGSICFGAPEISVSEPLSRS